MLTTPRPEALVAKAVVKHSKHSPNCALCANLPCCTPRSFGLSVSAFPNRQMQKSLLRWFGSLSVAFLATNIANSIA